MYLFHGKQGKALKKLLLDKAHLSIPIEGCGLLKKALIYFSRILRGVLCSFGQDNGVGNGG